MHLTNRYHYPPYSLLQQHEQEPPAQLLNGTDLARLLSAVTPVQFVQAVTSPQVVTYHFDLENPFMIRKISGSIQGLHAAIHMPITVVPSRTAHFALQIAPTSRTTIYFSNVIKRVQRENRGIHALLGVDEENNLLTFDLTAMPHTLIAGTTGSGKSVLMNSIIASLCYNYSPNDCRFVMIDPKQVELSRWDRLGDFLHCPVVTDTSRAPDVLEELCRLMDSRYKAMRRRHVNESEGLFPRIVVIIDELADLMLTNRKGAETSIVRIAQLGRAAGIHLLLATQRPTVNVVTGLIKANVPCRIALKVASARDSGVILDHGGAEHLLGRGDALISFPDRTTPVRFQAPFISSKDVSAIASWWSKEPNRR